MPWHCGGPLPEKQIKVWKALFIVAGGDPDAAASALHCGPTTAQSQVKLPVQGSAQAG